MIAASLICLDRGRRQPVRIRRAKGEGIAIGIATALLLIFVVAACFLKGRRLHGAIGILFAPLAIYGACRIGKPGSAWARHRYGERRPKKQAKAERRFPPGGAPIASRNPSATWSAASRARASRTSTEQAVAATREAGQEVRAAAERVVHPDEDRRDDGPKTDYGRFSARQLSGEAGSSASRTAGHSSSMTLK